MFQKAVKSKAFLRSALFGPSGSGVIQDERQSELYYRVFTARKED